MIRLPDRGAGWRLRTRTRIRHLIFGPRAAWTVHTRREREIAATARTGSLAGLGRLDHERYEGDGSVVDSRGDLPAALAGEGDPSGLKTDVAVARRDI